MRPLVGDDMGDEDPVPAMPADNSAPIHTEKRPRRERRPQEKFNRLMASAVVVFAEEGYVGTSVHAICRHAGVSIGSFYDHFDDKADLMLHVIEQIAEELARPVILDPAELEQQLTELIASPTAGLIRAWFEAAAVEPRLRTARMPIRRRMIGRYAEWVRVARERLEMRSDLDDDTAARGVIALVKEALTTVNEPKPKRIAGFTRLIWFTVFGESPAISGGQG